MSTIDKIKEQFNEWTENEAKHATGNKSAGTRARKALSELAKLSKQRRAEISDEKEAADAT